jgi:hypothetical protein
MSLIVARESVTNPSPIDYQPVPGLMVPVEPNGYYLLEYVLKVAAAPGSMGIMTMADGPVDADVVVQDGAAFTGDLDAAMLVTLTGLAETKDAGGHVMLYFTPANTADVTIVAGSMVRATRV